MSKSFKIEGTIDLSLEEVDGRLLFIRYDTFDQTVRVVIDEELDLLIDALIEFRNANKTDLHVYEDGLRYVQDSIDLDEWCPPEDEFPF